MPRPLPPPDIPTTAARDGRLGPRAAQHHGLLSLFVVLWGGNFVLAEVALREMAPISFSVARFVAGGAALVALFYGQCWADARREGRAVSFWPRLAPEDRPRLLLVAVLGAALAPWLGIEGLALTHGARAALWLALGPVVSSAIGYFMRTERIGRYGLIGTVLATLGALALAADGLRPDRGYWLGDLLLGGALLAAVVELHLIKPLAHRYGATATVAARTVIGGALYVLVATPALVGETWGGLSLWVWVAILFGGSIGVGVGQWVKVRALRTLGPTRVVLYGNLVPVAALLLAWLALSTVPSRLEVLSAVLILLGAICLQILDRPAPTSAQALNGDGEVEDVEALERHTETG